MGMMNNCCYRVKVHPRQTNSEQAGRAGRAAAHHLPCCTCAVAQLSACIAARPGPHSQTRESIPFSLLTAPCQSIPFPLRSRRLCAAVRAPNHRGGHRGRLDEPCGGPGQRCGERLLGCSRLMYSGRLCTALHQPEDRMQAHNWPPTLVSCPPPFAHSRRHWSRRPVAALPPPAAALPSCSPWRRWRHTTPRTAAGEPADAVLMMKGLMAPCCPTRSTAGWPPPSCKHD